MGHCPITERHVFDRSLTRCARYILNNYDATLFQRVFKDIGLCNFSNNVFKSDSCAVFKYINSLYDDFSSIMLLDFVSQHHTS